MTWWGLGVDLGTTSGAAVVAREGGRLEVLEVIDRQDVPIEQGADGAGALLDRFVNEGRRRSGGHDPGELVLTHPAAWGKAELTVLQQAARHAAPSARLRLVPDPVAAAVEVASNHHLAAGARIAVVDLGGGSLDVAVLQVSDPALQETLPELDDTEAFFASAGVELRVTRAQYDGLITDDVERCVAVVDRALESAGVSAEALTGIYLIGAASRPPAVRAAMEARFGDLVHTGSDPELTVARGAARLTFQPVSLTKGPEPAAQPAVVDEATALMYAAEAQAAAQYERGGAAAPVPLPAAPPPAPTYGYGYGTTEYPPGPGYGPPGYGQPGYDNQGYGNGYGQPTGGPVPMPVPVPGPRDPDQERRKRILMAVAAAVVVALIGAGAILTAKGKLFGGVTQNQASGGGGSSDTGSDTSDDDSSDDVTNGVDPAQSTQVAALASVTANYTAADNQDAAGDPTNYSAGNTIDGDVETTWRSDQQGCECETLTYDFGSPRIITGVGMTNGFTKVDPTSGEDRYQQERRITQVTWSFDDGTSETQDLTDGDTSIQRQDITPVWTATVTLTIDTVSEPGDPRFDYTAVSEVEIYGQ